ncbi:MAG TPA: amino acid ABC transporter substrate-binding protein [Bordetella sp.]
MHLTRIMAAWPRKRLCSWQRRLQSQAAFAALAILPVAQQAQATDTLAKIASTHRIIIGHRQSELPFSYVANGKVIGYAIDICQKVVEGLQKQLNLDHIEIDYQLVATATRFIQLNSGNIDLECATTTNNAERRKIAEFSYPYFFTATRYVAKKQAGLHTIADLAGHSVVSTTGTIDVDQLNAVNLAQHLNISVLLRRTHSDSFQLVENGQASAFVMDDILLAGLVASSGHPGDYTISQDAFNRPEPYGILIPAGDIAFKSAVDRVLRTLYASHEIDQLYAKWFMQPIAPDGRNLKLPMSPELRDWLAAPREYLD